MTPGTRVRWTATDEQGNHIVVKGVVSGPGPHGRIEVLGDDGNIHHIQPAWVALDE